MTRNVRIIANWKYLIEGLFELSAVESFSTRLVLRMFYPSLSCRAVAGVTEEPKEKIKCWIIRVLALMQIPCNARVSRPGSGPRWCNLAQCTVGKQAVIKVCLIFLSTGHFYILLYTVYEYWFVFTVYLKTNDLINERMWFKFWKGF